MPTYGHELKFGVFLTPTPDRVLPLAQLADGEGLDLVTVQDHPYHPAFLDAWTLAAVIAARTERVHVSLNVANLPLRPPAVLAKSVATLDLLTGGRAELGLGAGAMPDGVAMLGGPRRSPGEAVAALEEAIELIRALWTPGQPVTFEGEHYRLEGAPPGPIPPHRPRIWVGALKPRMLRLVGRLGDGWWPSESYVPPERLAEANKIIDEAALEAGRSPQDVRRLYNVGRHQGSAAEWAERLAGLNLTYGMGTFVLADDDPRTIQLFAAEVAPAVRELIESEQDAPAGEPEAPAAHESATIATPAPGVRLSGERAWDESTRPTAPVPAGARPLTHQEQAAGQHLVDVHDHLRSELEQVRDLIEQVVASRLSAGQARAAINRMTMRQNDWTLGAYCSAYCRVVTTHHTLEDQSLFPRLRRADPGLTPVLTRLEEEHHVIHGILERVDQALVATVESPDGLDLLRAEVDLLTDALLSHLSYEERELVEPLSRVGF
ncbi:LLM class flavin-dependent oxidoreductase [Nonomuraea soli]|uniref:Alkanesulfonate monooxygenase SsuD/methylene tetrahydromethanopterin reductase-like flavin-dependent oxidoreductase (Luciferase family) n=1 Tax=Nonomuraea soli TaxID=1032476 RepID=A0A7W0HMP4_9ACTN|nr:LLM class flavin-dependent oxidoreductase [Nonomuraea soli]MBA2888671.1 alkanesulfonate monooxygenase SsuD/methylene tetrahydromethanopterin reductase-like flavin-dependent oxidoreductase (luciferase family) [Nonomuraea soli]